MSMLKANGVELPTPSSYDLSLEELSKAERNANGTMIKEIIAFKVKIEAGWKSLTQDEMSILAATKRFNFFQLEYFDMESGAMKIGTFYAGTPKASAMDFKNGKVSKWINVTMNFIER